MDKGLYGAASWEHERRVVYKAEAMEKGTNTCFIATTRTADPKELYAFYARRGESENWIKDFKLHVRADRLSCNRSISNQFRLLLPTAAYWLMDALRRKLVASEPGQRRDLRAEQGALVPRKKVPEPVALQVKERQREVAWSGERQDTFPVPAEQLHKIIRDLDEVRRDLAGVEEVQNALMLRPRSARMAHSARVFSL